MKFSHWLKIRLSEQGFTATGQPHYSKVDSRPRKPPLPPEYRGEGDSDVNGLYMKYLLNGDEDAFKTLYQSVFPRLVRIMYAQFYDQGMVQLPDIEDAVSFAFEKITRSKANRMNLDFIDKGTGKSVYNFLFTVALNKLKSLVTATQRKEKHTRDIGRSQVPQDSHDEKLQAARTEIERIANSLEGREKQVFQMYAQGKSREEIAKATNTSDATVTRTWQSIMQKIGRPGAKAPRSDHVGYQGPEKYGSPTQIAKKSKKLKLAACFFPKGQSFVEWFAETIM